WPGRAQLDDPRDRQRRLLTAGEHAHMTTTAPESRSQRFSLWPAFGVLALVISLVASVFVGAANITVWDVLTGGLTEAHAVYLVEARLPRTAAAALAGASLAIAGLLMQLLTRNRFVEPSTA